MLIDTQKSPFAKAAGLPQADVRWLPGLWQERADICADVTIPHVMRLFEDDQVFHAVANFKIAAGLMAGNYEGPPFDDGDFYKVLEGAMIVAGRRQDQVMIDKIEATISLIGQALQPDGYLSTKQIIGEQQNNGVRRQGDINDFEAYNFGHLFTAACTWKRIAGRDSFLAIAIKAAGYLEQLYKEADRTGQIQTAVCPSHYMGLIELYRTTGDVRFLATAKLAIDLRDRIQNGTDDNQDRYPLREHSQIVGHGVRATYLYAGVADLYLETGDTSLKKVLDDVWQDLNNTKLYITGGCGALYSGVSPFGNFQKGQMVHQAFGYAYQLPNITAYNETCATLGHIFWTHRLFAGDPQARYFDVIERSLLNLVLAAVSLDGDTFFYENMLRRARKLDYELIWPLERVSVMPCFCCPANLARSLVSTHEYLYMIGPDTIWTGIYGASEARFDLAGGAALTLVQSTDYPWDGTIRFSCREVIRNQPVILQLRIPAWAAGGSLNVNGSVRPLTGADSMTYLPIRLDNPQNDVVELHLEMPVRYTVAHPLVEEATGQVAVERGPLVYCVESSDAAVATLDDVHLLADADFATTPLVIRGRQVIALETEAALLNRPGYQPGVLYQTLRTDGISRVPLRLIPYFAWDNRGYGEMRIWLPILHHV